MVGSPRNFNSNRLSDAPSAEASVPPPAESEESPDSLAALQSFVAPEELSVVFQPIVRTRDGTLFAHEVLVRCSADPYMSPPKLFEGAVAHRCTGRLGRMIREIAVQHVSRVPLFVNIHPQELSEGWLIRPDDPVFMHDSEVYLEITESAAFTHFELCMHVLNELGSRGSVFLVVDDFGAGYSNLLRIADLHPRVVKLDRALVMDLDRRPRKLELVHAVVELCERLGARVVAEGVETEAELEALLTTGVHYVQGYFCARPAFPPPDIHWPDGFASTASPTARPPAPSRR